MTLSFYHYLRLSNSPLLVQCYSLNIYSEMRYAYYSWTVSCEHSTAEYSMSRSRNSSSYKPMNKMSRSILQQSALQRHKSSSLRLVRWS